EFEPFCEPINPMIGGNVLRMHSEAVASLGIHVKLGGFMGGSPLVVERATHGGQTKRVVGSGGNEDRGRVRRNCRTVGQAAGVDGGDKGGSACGSVVEGYAFGHCSTG